MKVAQPSLTDFPEVFQEWVDKKVSVQDLATLAATCHETGDPPQHGVTRALSFLYMSWRVLRGEEDSLAKEEPES